VSGPLFALAAYVLWGVLPAWWKALGHVPTPDVLAHRVVWSLVFTLGVVVVLRRRAELAAVLRDPRKRLALVASGALIGANWGIFIWAVSVDRLVEASFGYYLTPLVNVVLGLALLGERLARPQAVAVAIAAVGVAALGVGLAHAPWLPLSLALSFGLYGLVRKLTAVSSLVGLTLETGLLAPLALGWLAFRTQAEGAAFFPEGAGTVALLVLSGVVTALPLIFFASAAKRMSLSTLGLFQYLAPTLSFLLAVVVYGEPFGLVHAFAFGCIWAAIGLYAFSTWRLTAAAQRVDRDRREDHRRAGEREAADGLAEREAAGG
jgi:chloramphenicol-sensitive protein RarD